MTPILALSEFFVAVKLQVDINLSRGLVLHDVFVKPLVWVHVWHGLFIRALGPSFSASVSAIPIRIAMFVL